MNPILIPIDFSAASDNAMHYGAQLAVQLGAPVVLTHVYEVPISISDVPVMALPIEELKNSAEAGLDRCREELLRNYPGLEVKTESRLGAVYPEVNDICEDVSPFAIVMGSHGTSGFERMLFGSTTLSVVRHAHYPVIAVPSGYTKFSFNTVALAADLNTEKFPFQTIKKFVQKLNAQLHVVHITSEREKGEAINLLEPLSELSPVYENLLNKDVKDGLLEYVQQNHIDLLIVLPHEHNLTERMFFKLHTENIIASTPVPVLAIRC